MDIVERLRGHACKMRGEFLNDDKLIDESADEIERLRALTEWRDISTVPYNTPVLMWTHDGNVVQNFLYDTDWQELASIGITHWKSIVPPQEPKT